MSTVRPWSEIIDEAEERGGFTHDEKMLSGEWSTCPCGQQDPCIPRDDAFNGVPEDHELSELGVEFCVAVVEGDFDRARKAIEKIESRAVIVLAQVLRKEYDDAVAAWEAAGHPDRPDVSPYENFTTEDEHPTIAAKQRSWNALCEYCDANGLDPREIPQ